MADCRLRIKIGLYELEAEGPQSFVEKHYGLFSELIPDSEPRTPTGGGSGTGNVLPPATESMLTPIFHRDGKGRLLSLTAKLPGENRELDAALLILLGHKELRGEDLVSADEMLYGLRQSGYTVDRADRIATRGEDGGLLTRSGIRRGTRYRLTNQGATKARELGRELLKQVA